MSLIDSTKEHEGFSEKPYIDVLVKRNPMEYGIPPSHMKIIQEHFHKLKVTIGYGFTFMSHDEAFLILELRLTKIRNQIIKEFPFIQNDEVLDILTEMAFQMGLNGLKGFKNMIASLEANDLYAASLHGLDSSWAKKQTPVRAYQLMAKLKNAQTIHNYTA